MKENFTFLLRNTLYCVLIIILVILRLFSYYFAGSKIVGGNFKYISKSTFILLKKSILSSLCKALFYRETPD